MTPPPHRFWHSRGYLPHFDCPGQIQAITIHLGDSLPQAVIDRFEAELDDLLGPPPSSSGPPGTAAVPSGFTTIGDSRTSPTDDAPEKSGLRQDDEAARGRRRSQDAERRKRIEAWLDAGHGECWLRRPDIAPIVENALLHFDGTRYRLIAWVIMPNHVHFLAQMHEGWPLGKVMDSLKDFTAKAANKRLGRSGTFWAREYHDRFIRDELHFENAVRYIERNPVKARLCATPEDWPWGSARRRLGPPPSPSGPPGTAAVPSGL